MSLLYLCPECGGRLQNAPGIVRRGADGNLYGGLGCVLHGLFGMTVDGRIVPFAEMAPDPL